MTSPMLPAIQGRRYDVETLQHNAASLARQADQEPTYLRHRGQIAYVVLTAEIFDEVWPDRRRAFSVDEMPDWALAMLERTLDGPAKDES